MEKGDLGGTWPSVAERCRALPSVVIHSKAGGRGRGDKRASRDPQSRPRGLRTLQKCPAHVPYHKKASGLAQASGRAAVDPQRGRQSAATRRVGACLNSFRKVFEFFEFKRVSPGPAHSAPELGPHFLGLQNRSEICPKIDPRVDVILVSFWVSLGSLLASLLGPLGRPNRPKFGPRGPKIAPRRPKKASRPAKMIIFIPNRDFSPQKKH